MASSIPALSCVVLLSTACHPVVDGVDPEALGYGPGPHVNRATGYDEDPLPRPAPMPWTPPEREVVRPGLGQHDAAAEPTPVLPSSDVVRICEHWATLVGGEEAEIGHPACLRRYRIARVFRPIGTWKTLVSCIEGARDVDGIAACELASPQVFAPPDTYPREAFACMHLFALLIVEETGAEPMLERDELLEFQPLVRECVDTLVTEARKDRKPSEYAQMLTCIEEAETSSKAETCDQR